MLRHAALLSVLLSVVSMAEARALIPCDQSQWSEASSALSDMNQMIDKVIESLDHGDFDIGGVMGNWFGVSSSRTAILVKDNMNRARAFSEVVTFLCIASSEAEDLGAVYAEVLPDGPFVVHLGAPFFEADTDGYNSRAGILLHELTHFILVGATNSFSGELYGVEEARRKAQEDPDFAAQNADNYEYFAEQIYFSIED